MSSAGTLGDTARLETASAFTLVDGGVPFVVGPDSTGLRLGIIRVGGHLEPGETPWACAARESLEEASLRISPVAPPGTYRATREECRPVEWDGGEWPVPVCANDRSRTYLAVADGPAAPGAEAKALVLLAPDEVGALCRSPGTLASFVARGGRVVPRTDDWLTSCGSMPLDPRGPNVLLRLLEIHGASLWGRR